MIARVLAPLIMAALSGVTAADTNSPPTRVEVFTTTEQAVAGASAIDFKQQIPDINLQVYRLDGIRQMELTLSGNLPNDAEAAKRIVLQRIRLEQVTDYTLKLRSAAAAKVGFFLEQHRDALMVEEFQLSLITHGRRRDESLASSAKNVVKRPLSDHCATVVLNCTEK